MQKVDPYGKESKRQNVALAVGGGLLLVALVVGFGISALGINVPKQQPVLAQKSQVPGPVLPAVADTKDVLPIQKPAEVKMPDDIYNWLEHLRRTDEKLASDTNAIGMSAGIDRVSDLASMYQKGLDGNFEDYNPANNTDSLNGKTDRTFQDLTAYFDSVPPPTECLPIYNAYKISLSETETNVHKIQQITNEAFNVAMKEGGDTGSLVDKLKSIYSDHKDGIDEHRRETDILVQQICDKYRTRKWFGIKPDPANPITKGMVDMLVSSMGN